MVESIGRADEARIGATFNGDDSVKGHAYTFLGVMFDHKAATVKCSKKVPDAMRQLDGSVLTIGGLESAIGKLFYASAVLGPAPLYYWLLKTTRRRLHTVNAGYSKVTDKAELPPAALAQLNGVADNAPRIVPKERASPKWVLYSDASFQGWGAVLRRGLRRRREVGDAAPQHQRGRDEGVDVGHDGVPRQDGGVLDTGVRRQHHDAIGGD